MRKIPANTMRHRAAFLVATESGDQYGQPQRSWRRASSARWVSIEPLRSREAFIGDQAQTTDTHVVRLSWTPDAPTTQQRMQVLHSGRTFDISSVVDEDEQHRVYRLMVTERADGTDG